jgi:hypothetical protein
MKKYKIKENYKKHSISCELFHNKNTKDSELPSNKEIYNLIKTLALKCSNLEKELVKLKQTVHIRQKKQTMGYLNTHCDVIKEDFTKWYENIKIEREDLEKVFDSDLSEGIKQVLKKNKSECICGFSHKPNVVYVYEKEWRVMTSEDMEKMIKHLNREFMKEFIIWRKENEKEIEGNEKRKEEEIICMIKVNGCKISVEKRAAEIKKWLYSEIEEKLEIYEYE